MSVTVPISQRAGRLPLNYEFTPADYRALLLQRLELYLSGDKVLLGTTDATTAPISNVGGWFNPSTRSMWAWNAMHGQYEPADIGFLNGTHGTTITASPTANRTLTIPDTTATYADGVANSTTTYTSATAAFVASDAGLPISGTNIPAGTTIASRTNSTTIVLSQAATATASGLTFHIGRAGTALLVQDVAIPKETVILTSTSGTVSTIDADVSRNFILTLTENSTIPSLTNMTLGSGKVIRIAIINSGTSYTVTWPTAGANEIKWPSSPSHTMPVASASRPNALAIFTITEANVGLTPHLWGDPEVSGFGSSGVIDTGGTDSAGGAYAGGDLPPSKGREPYNIP